MSTKESIINLIFPPHCAFCGALTEHTDICPACEKNLPFRPEGNILVKVGQFDCAVTFYYEDMIISGIRALKFSGKSNRSRIFARSIAQTAAEQLGGQFDAITFVPLHSARNFNRGYDQAQLLAEECARLWQVKPVKTLRKIRNNRPQSTVKTPAERRANALGAYKIRNKAEIANKRFLLIDDVLTTGSTMEACAEMLLQAGARSVVCAALAGGHRKNPKSVEKSSKNHIELLAK